MKSRHRRQKVIIKRRFSTVNRRKQNFSNIIKKYFAIFVLLTVGYVIFPRDINIAEYSLSDAMLPQLNLRIEDVRVEGLDVVNKEDILQAAKIKLGDNIFSFSPADAKQSIESLPWIARSNVHRELPNKVSVYIEEEKPRAIFFKGDDQYYINHNGIIIDKVKNPNILQNYIYVTGENSNFGFSDILDQIYTSEVVYNQLRGLSRVDNRRWDIVLKEGALIKLPEKNVASALKKLGEMLKDENFLPVCSMIDLRFMPDRIYIKF